MRGFCGVACSPGLASATPGGGGPATITMLVVLLTAGSLLRMRRACAPGRVLAECGESARQTTSKDSYPVLERAARAFGSTRGTAVPVTNPPAQPAATSCAGFRPHLPGEG
jgi:hypothetical protein